MDEQAAAEKPLKSKKSLYSLYNTQEDYDAAVVRAKEREAKRLAHATAVAGVERLTEDAWAAFEGKAKWDSIVALRGPDFEHTDALKWFTCAVIRYKLSGVMRVGGMVNKTLPFIITPGYYSASPPGFACGHYLGHIVEAAQWLRIPYWSVNAENSGLLFTAPYGRCLKAFAEDNILPANVRKTCALAGGIECT